MLHVPKRNGRGLGGRKAKKWTGVSVFVFCALEGLAFAETEPSAPSNGVAQASQASKVRVGFLVSFGGLLKINGKAVKTSRPLFRSDILQTDAQGAATILIGSDTVLYLGTGTRLELTEIEIDKRKVELSLPRGKMRALVKSSDQKLGVPQREFTVRTKAATLGVRGTQFVVDSVPGSEQPLRVSTLEGVVAWLGTSPSQPTSEAVPTGVPPVPPRETLISAGQEVVLAARAAPGAPQLISSAEMKVLSQAVVPTPPAVQTPVQLISYVPVVRPVGQVPSGGAPVSPRPGGPVGPTPRGGWNSNLIEDIEQAARGGGDLGPLAGGPAGLAPGSGAGVTVALDPIVDRAGGTLSGNITSEKQD